MSKLSGTLCIATNAGVGELSAGVLLDKLLTVHRAGAATTQAAHARLILAKAPPTCSQGARAGSCPVAPAGCVTTTACAGAGAAAVTVSNCFDKRVAFLAAEYTDPQGNGNCANKTQVLSPGPFTPCFL